MPVEHHRAGRGELLNLTQSVRNQAKRRARPAKQRLGTDDAALGEIDHRLVFEEELIAADGAAQPFNRKVLRASRYRPKKEVRAAACGVAFSNASKVRAKSPSHPWRRAGRRRSLMSYRGRSSGRPCPVPGRAHGPARSCAIASSTSVDRNLASSGKARLGYSPVSHWRWGQEIGTNSTINCP